MYNCHASKMLVGAAGRYHSAAAHSSAIYSFLQLLLFRPAPPPRAAARVRPSGRAARPLRHSASRTVRAAPAARARAAGPASAAAASCRQRSGLGARGSKRAADARAVREGRGGAAAWRRGGSRGGGGRRRGFSRCGWGGRGGYGNPRRDSPPAGPPAVAPHRRLRGGGRRAAGPLARARAAPRSAACRWLCALQRLAVFLLRAALLLALGLGRHRSPGHRAAARARRSEARSCSSLAPPAEEARAACPRWAWQRGSAGLPAA